MCYKWGVKKNNLKDRKFKFFYFQSLCTELVTISTSPKMTAECGKHVTLNCNVSSSRNVLSVKYMEWSLNKISLCSVDSEGKMTKHHIHTLSDFHCKYTHGQLSLILHNVRPLESANANYRCKLQSEQGAGHRYTTVELQGQSPHLFFITAVMNLQNTAERLVCSVLYCLHPCLLHSCLLPCLCWVIAVFHGV